MAAFLLSGVPAPSPALCAEDPKSVRRAEPTDEGRLEALHREAEGRIAVNDFRGAIGNYREILLLEPDDAVAYARMGHSYLILGDSGRAEDAFRLALDIDPENETAVWGLRKIADPDIDLGPMWRDVEDEEIVPEPLLRTDEEN